MKDVKIFASCHNHSSFSDADYAPEKLVELAAEIRARMPLSSCEFVLDQG